MILAVLDAVVEVAERGLASMRIDVVAKAIISGKCDPVTFYELRMQFMKNHSAYSHKLFLKSWTFLIETSTRGRSLFQLGRSFSLTSAVTAHCSSNFVVELPTKVPSLIVVSADLIVFLHEQVAGTGLIFHVTEEPQPEETMTHLT